MKTVTLELPDNVAIMFENMSNKRKADAVLIAACIAQNQHVTLPNIFAKIDEQVAKSGVTEDEIDSLLDTLS